MQRSRRGACTAPDTGTFKGASRVHRVVLEGARTLGGVLAVCFGVGVVMLVESGAAAPSDIGSALQQQLEALQFGQVTAAEAQANAQADAEEILTRAAQ